MLKGKLATFAVAFLLLNGQSSPVYAVNPPGILVSAPDLFYQNVVITVKNAKNKNVKKTFAVSCFDSAPGKTAQGSGGMYFQSFASEVASLKKRLKRAKKPRLKNSLRSQLAISRALNKAGQTPCIEPAFLSLSPYSGPFGEREARRLMEVFALGGSEAMVANAVQVGLNRAVDDLVTPKPDPYSNEVMDKLSCDTNPDDQVRNCYRAEEGAINDYYLDGMISAINLRTIVSSNPARMALLQWVMDERAPVNPRVLGNNNRWMLKNHLERVLDPFSTSGNYKQYVFGYVNDPLGQGEWLSGKSNHVVSALGLQLGIGNEDFARELMELLLMGPNDKDGNPNYSDLDVYKSSQILSGWSSAQVQDPNGNNINVLGYFPNLHASGSHTIFGGTPFQITVADSSIKNGEELARQLFVVKKSQIAFELARRLWKRFISSRGNTAAYSRLAKTIEDNDFNLWPVMARMMRSKAFYAPESAETIMKNPHTLFVTYARMTGIPVGDYNALRSWLDDMGMLLGRPPTVFGFTYQNELLSSDVYQLERFRSLYGLTMYQNLEDLKKEYNWTPHNGLIASIPLSGLPEESVVDAMIRRMNMADDVTPGQRAEYIKFVANYLGDCYSTTDPTCFTLEGARKKLYRSPPDMGDTQDDFYQVRQFLVMLGTNPYFQTM